MYVQALKRVVCVYVQVWKTCVCDRCCNYRKRVCDRYLAWIRIEDVCLMCMCKYRRRVPSMHTRVYECVYHITCDLKRIHVIKIYTIYVYNINWICKCYIYIIYILIYILYVYCIYTVYICICIYVVSIQYVYMCVIKIYTIYVYYTYI